MNLKSAQTAFTCGTAILLLLFSLFSCKRNDEKNEQLDNLKEFMEARKTGNSSLAYEMLSESTKNIFSKQVFDNYCFVYRVIDYKVLREEGLYFELSYNFYDKKYKKGSDELYTFYISQNSEKVKIENGKIVFPHIGFVLIRKHIEQKDIKKVEETLIQMAQIDSENPDLKETVEKMGFMTGTEK